MHLMIMFFILLAMAVDLSMSRASIFFPQSSVDNLVIIFLVITIVLIPAQFFLIRLTRRKRIPLEGRGNLYREVLHKAAFMAQVALTLILILVLLDVLLMSRYNAFLLMLSTSLSYGLSIGILAILVKQFLSWFKKNLHPVILLYTLALIVTVLNVCSTLLLVNLEVPQRPDIIGPHIGTTIMFIPGSLNATLNAVQTTTLIAGFILMWCATSMLLRNYSHKLGRAIYWIMVATPLVYFLSQFLSLFFNFFVDVVKLDPIYFSIVLTLIFTLSKPVGAILFGIAFWILARKLRYNETISNYMIISMYGVMLLFVSNQAVVLTAGPYPPFGLNTIAFMGLSSYMLLEGIYASAISVSQDAQLRRSIKKYAETESRLLQDIGYAEMENKLEKKVLVMSRQIQKSMKEEAKIETSLSDEDVRAYLDEVLGEIERYRKENGRPK
jgi:hypothetical protein